MQTEKNGHPRFVITRPLIRSVLAAFVLLAFASGLQAQTARFAIGEWAPYTGQTLPGNGLAAEIVTAACKAAGLEASYEFVPWKRAESSVLRNLYFATFPYLRSPERDGRFLFSEVLFNSGLGVLTLGSNEKTRFLRFSTPADLKGLSILIIAGSDPVKKLLEDAGATVIESQQMDLAIRMLESNRGDAIVDDQAVLYQALEALPEGKRALFNHAKTPLGEKTAYRLMSAQSYPDAARLIKQFNIGLAKIRESGELERIEKRHGL